MKIIILVIAVCLFSCSGNPNQKPDNAQQRSNNIPTVETKPYKEKLGEVIALKENNRKRWHTFSLKNKGDIFSKAVTEIIVPAWIGTLWNFNGTTETPNQGTIACGYFVTTVLRDAGLPIARIKMAQCASEEMITTLVQKKNIQRFSNVDMEVFLKNIKAQGEGLYIIGLDNHTGFIHCTSDAIFFIHASYAGTRKVVKEIAAQNIILKNSKYKITGKISADENSLNRWIAKG